MKEIEYFLEYLKVIKKHSEHTIRNYESDILEFYEFNNNKLHHDKEIVANYLKYLYDKEINKSSISRKLSSLRTFYSYLLKENKIDFNYFKNIKNPKKEKNLPKYVKEIDVDKMFLVPDTKSKKGQRNLLIIRLLYGTGIRVSELVNIKIKLINDDKSFQEYVMADLHSHPRWPASHRPSPSHALPPHRASECEWS